ncbi:hypothetical protein P344_06455 [Spiroplasma mirum ATCC 29335]|uniref:Uncharacterized protein n=1 Tax=Spiroplasma mirum ATCC 29335 TaxID=838561 RepID=W6AXX2_9MOLU|nr:MULTISPECIES: hypothetical protein [Spiroplasma]AHI58594.1 hypothetical protein P344_06455 [Spiroplasma mirum ATCC 29335]
MSYFDFSDPNNISVINNDFSGNQMFKLDLSYFNWLPLTNELEANDIPSLIPGDINLSSAE